MKYISIVSVQTYCSLLVSILNTSLFKFSCIWVESIWSLCRLHMDSSWMIQKYTDLVVFQVESNWSMWGCVKYTSFAILSRYTIDSSVCCHPPISTNICCHLPTSIISHQCPMPTFPITGI